ncbi:hypothetical protein A2382_03370 [Candidatus Woesebacteria bacterium RIFOXYB1_FULL_38_16]|uniref:Uncharacterized protein n=1 Tax=Candidatus Woesebacteria bacterium RIFOXYB1_FULL_38_16 TaxID=1802538 RepID=A0A1F8CRE2_9BACT|nr:MAG: hypothetical protein A2191_02890 [Candidatus Woesebacteria bacterium RIFOXYA1_FULL_38_9]OGM78907.1 MAG: hypothetical protein A2382_03370 [Candidatus Woesebacteria bacterium RIFOXYB1_FULL_38_16]
MLKTKYINEFYFEKARYRISDGKNNVFFLDVDYKNNCFSTTFIKSVALGNMKSEVEKIARDLLSRKHNVNFVNKK